MSTILVIDDEPHILDNVVTLLEAKGYTVVGTDDPEHGIDLAETHRPDLIVCDVMMPQLTGHDVLEQIRDETTLQTAPFIFLTAKSTPQDVRDGMSKGADDYLTKPFRADELLEAVEVRLARQEAVEEHHQQYFDELRRNMSAALPHELRTPLAAIQGYAEVLRTDWDALSASDGRAMLDEILSATDRLKRLVENYALYVELESHPGDEAADNEAGPTSASVIQEAASEHASMYQRVGDVVCDVPAAALAIQERHLKRLVIELVDNALKFSAPGETVQVRGSRDDGRYYVEVVDRGRGMDAEQVNRLGAFVQFDRSEYEQQGVGLGLALVHRIVKRSAGAVHINSEEGAGTTVRVALPIESRDSAVPGRTSTSNRRSV